MKKAFLLVALFIGTLSYSQNKVEVKETKSGLLEVTYYHDNGKVAQTGFINNNKKNHGVWKLYDVNGNLKSTGNYNNGMKVGTWVFWNNPGQQNSHFARVEFNKNNRIATVYNSDSNTKIALSEIDEE
ncbi:toxin-antitoxin system YwqK family antitoxin [Wenyingzhuangia sp. IMCC45574]